MPGLHKMCRLPRQHSMSPVEVFPTGIKMFHRKSVIMSICVHALARRGRPIKPSTVERALFLCEGVLKIHRHCQFNNPQSIDEH
ncbi:hypothetical protein KOR42_15560 [Thalassoglobus neptunius]|uniref:Uncharacterized protein n=1 Tax=Thalassoglobus neptunius TaxID=1938619 RepID=A0A5C5X7V1_9PLAN|nr:hypothetical protein KOR42_15560 [Thalassoglobus neptunius]